MKGHFIQQRGKTTSGYPKDKPVGFDVNQVPIFGYDPRYNCPVCYSRIGGDPTRRCMSPVRMRNGRCKTHRGNSPVGMLHPAFAGGHKTVVIDKYRKEIAIQINDPEYLHLKNVLALNHIRMLEVVQRMNRAGFDDQTYELLEKAAEGLMHSLEFDEVLIQNLAALGAKSPLIKFAANTEKLCKYIKRGGEERRLHKEISAIAKDRAKLVEVELKRVTMEKNYMTADAALTLFITLMRVVVKHVKDKHVLRGIKDEIDRLAINPANRKALGGVMFGEDTLEVQTGLRQEIEAEEERITHPDIIKMNPLLSDDEFEQALRRSSTSERFESIVPQGFQFNVEELIDYMEGNVHPSRKRATSPKEVYDREFKKPAINEHQESFLARGGIRKLAKPRKMRFTPLR